MCFRFLILSVLLTTQGAHALEWPTWLGGSGKAKADALRCRMLIQKGIGTIKRKDIAAYAHAKDQLARDVELEFEIDVHHLDEANPRRYRPETIDIYQMTENADGTKTCHTHLLARDGSFTGAAAVILGNNGKDVLDFIVIGSDM